MIFQTECTICILCLLILKTFFDLDNTSWRSKVHVHIIVFLGRIRKVYIEVDIPTYGHRQGSSRIYDEVFTFFIGFYGLNGSFTYLHVHCPAYFHTSVYLCCLMHVLFRLYHRNIFSWHIHLQNHHPPTPGFIKNTQHFFKTASMDPDANFLGQVIDSIQEKDLAHL